MIKENVQELCEKAIRHVNRKTDCFLPLSHFYRNKSLIYFQEIMASRTGVMTKYLKNWGGDPFSTLNRNLEGLFFSTQLDPKTKLPRNVSFYGNTRLYIPTWLLLNNNTNLYFSDFYCHYQNHKAQLVIAISGSSSDDFCKRSLVQLHPFNNPFWIMSFGILHVTTNITVEVFYTENIPIRYLIQWKCGLCFEGSKLLGKALTMAVGIPKNKECRVCNLAHVLETQMVLEQK